MDIRIIEFTKGILCLIGVASFFAGMFAWAGDIQFNPLALFALSIFTCYAGCIINTVQEND